MISCELFASTRVATAVLAGNRRQHGGIDRAASSWLSARQMGIAPVLYEGYKTRVVTPMSKLALIFGTASILCLLTNVAWTQKSAEPPQSQPPYPGDSQITFEWEYSCAGGKACSFTCPGSSGGSKVTKLYLYLGSIPLGKDQRTAAIFYNFTSEYFPHNNGFSISTGIGVLSCQVNGMTLNYSGPPRL